MQDALSPRYSCFIVLSTFESTQDTPTQIREWATTPPVTLEHLFFHLQSLGALWAARRLNVSPRLPRGFRLRHFGPALDSALDPASRRLSQQFGWRVQNKYFRGAVYDLEVGAFQLCVVLIAKASPSLK